MEATFYLPKMTAAAASIEFGSWRCRIEKMDSKSCNIIFFDEDEWKRFEEYAEEKGIENELG